MIIFAWVMFALLCVGFIIIISGSYLKDYTDEIQEQNKEDVYDNRQN